uniref:Secreted protein n=1 Tax=Setaria viridis TaxID=4556 RepID=A0A4U6THA5_SETVI|nr:hypothetical protein SEVIR_8G111650v2 [Setaria viridis]
MMMGPAVAVANPLRVLHAECLVWCLFCCRVPPVKTYAADRFQSQARILWGRIGGL